MKKIVFNLTFMFTVFLLVASASAAEKIGYITYIQGDVFKIVNDKKLKQDANAEIFLNDHLQTGAGGALEVVFNDDTRINLGEESNLTIDHYVYDPLTPENNKATFSFPMSSFHYISGAIAKLNPPKVKLNLDYGSIGIRGTEIWRDMVKDEETGQPMCRVYVENGVAEIYNQAGYVVLKHGEATKILSRQTAPAQAAVWSEAAILDMKLKSAPQ